MTLVAVASISFTRNDLEDAKAPFKLRRKVMVVGEIMETQIYIYIDGNTVFFVSLFLKHGFNTVDGRNSAPPGM